MARKTKYDPTPADRSGIIAHARRMRRLHLLRVLDCEKPCEPAAPFKDYVELAEHQFRLNKWMELNPTEKRRAKAREASARRKAELETETDDAE